MTITPTPTPGTGLNAGNPLASFGLADGHTVQDVFDENIGRPTAIIRSDRKDAEKQLDRALEVLGDDCDFQKVVDLGDFGATAKEAALKIAEINGLVAGLREVEKEHGNWQTSGSIQGDPSNPIPGSTPFNRGGVLGPGIADVLTAAAEENKFDIWEPSAKANFSLTRDFGVGNNPVLNTLFKVDAASPYQVADPGSLTTLRDQTVPILTIIPIRETIGTNYDVIYRAKTTDTQAAASRAEAAAAGESEYAWRWFKTRVRNISTSIPLTKEAVADDPTALQRVETDLVDELSLEWAKQGFDGSGSSEQIYGFKNAFGGTIVPASQVQDYNIFPNTIKSRDLTRPTNGYAMAAFRDLRRAIGDVEDTLIMHRIPTHLFLRSDICTDLDLVQYSKSATGSAAAASYTAEWVGGGPGEGRFMRFIWGLPVVKQNIGTTNSDTGLVGLVVTANRRSAELVMRQMVELERGYSSDDLVKFQFHIVCQIRVGLAVYDPAAFCKLVRNDP